MKIFTSRALLAGLLVLTLVIVGSACSSEQGKDVEPLARGGQVEPLEPGTGTKHSTEQPHRTEMFPSDSVHSTEQPHRTEWFPSGAVHKTTQPNRTEWYVD